MSDLTLAYRLHSRPEDVEVDAVLKGPRVTVDGVLARIFHPETRNEVGGIITSHVKSVVKTDQRGDSADAKLYRDSSAVCEARTARN
jgi:hypothetical protein